MRKAEISFSSLMSARRAVINTDLPDNFGPMDARSVGMKIRYVLAKEWAEDPNLIEIRVKVWQATQIVE